MRLLRWWRDTLRQYSAPVSMEAKLLRILERRGRSGFRVLPSAEAECNHYTRTAGVAASAATSNSSPLVLGVPEQNKEQR